MEYLIYQFLLEAILLIAEPLIIEGVRRALGNLLRVNLALPNDIGPNDGYVVNEPLIDTQAFHENPNAAKGSILGQPSQNDELKSYLVMPIYQATDTYDDVPAHLKEYLGWTDDSPEDFPVGIPLALIKVEGDSSQGFSETDQASFSASLILPDLQEQVRDFLETSTTPIVKSSGASQGLSSIVDPAGPELLPRQVLKDLSFLKPALTIPSLSTTVVSTNHESSISGFSQENFQVSLYGNGHKFKQGLPPEVAIQNIELFIPHPSSICIMFPKPPPQILRYLDANASLERTINTSTEGQGRFYLMKPGSSYLSRTAKLRSANRSRNWIQQFQEELFQRVFSRHGGPIFQKDNPRNFSNCWIHYGADRKHCMKCSNSQRCLFLTPQVVAVAHTDQRNIPRLRKPELHIRTIRIGFSGIILKITKNHRKAVMSSILKSSLESNRNSSLEEILTTNDKTTLYIIDLFDPNTHRLQSPDDSQEGETIDLTDEPFQDCTPSDLELELVDYDLIIQAYIPYPREMPLDTGTNDNNHGRLEFFH